MEITPKSGEVIDPIQLLKATYDSGVSVAEMSMIARGQIVKADSDGISLQTESSQSFAIVQNELSKQLESMVGTGKNVTIKGLLYQKDKKQKKQTLPQSVKITVLEIQQE